nr:hypothetical protein [Kibdelosporangium sp. MJ126-NF4]
MNSRRRIDTRETSTRSPIGRQPGMSSNPSGMVPFVEMMV